MKNIHKLSYILAGVLITILVGQLVTPALAVLAKKTITVYTGVNIYVDDAKLSPTDANGNPVEPFVYNGTTYLPIRAIGQAVGKAVQWDGSTSSVYLGNHDSTTPAVWLKDLDYFTQSDFNYYAKEDDNDKKDNMGNYHNSVIYYEFTRTYKINGQYSRIAGILYQTYEYRSATEKSALTIYGDGRELYTASVSTGIEPIPFSVDLSGVLELKVTFNTNNYYGSYAAIGECGLYT